MLEQMLGEMIADKKDGTATEAKAIAALEPTLRAKLAEIDTMNKSSKLRRSRSILTQNGSYRCR